MGREQLRRARSRRGDPPIAGTGKASPAIRCCITCKNVRSSTGCCRGAKSMAWRWSATARLGITTFRARAPAGGRVLEEIARAHRASARQVALRFLTRRPTLFTIPKASTAQHTEDNAGAGNLQLDAAEIARLERAFPLGSRRSLPML